MIGIVRASAIAMAVLMLATGSLVLANGPDAYTTAYSIELETGQEVESDLTAITGKDGLFLYRGNLPEGLRLDLDIVGHEWYGNKCRTFLRGDLSAAPGTYTFTLTDDSDYYEITVLVTAGECTVTYDAGIGAVNGRQTWSETVTKGTFASLPAAAYSGGAYTFLGWAVSATSVDVLGSYTATDDITLHAVWKRNTVRISDATATITSGQTSLLPMRTVPSDATLRVSSLGGLRDGSVRASDEGIVLDMAGVEPGTYFVTISASYTGYITGESVITVKVPITIVKPIE